jgi:hypothetical protein
MVLIPRTRSRVIGSSLDSLLLVGSGLLTGPLSRTSSVSDASPSTTAPQCAPFHNSGHQPSAHLVVGTVSTPTWFPDIGAKQHVTSDLATLTNFAPYLGNDHLHIGDSKGLSISHIGHIMLCSPKRTFILSNVLHVPHITKPLLSVQKFCRDNNVFLNFAPLYFM